MKKFSKMLVGILVCVMSAGLFIACSKVTITGAEVVRGTLDTTIMQNSELDTSGIKVRLTYSNRTTKTVDRADLQVGTIDTSTLGEKDLEITYNNEYTFITKINVVIGDEYVAGLSSLKSQLLIDFQDNKSSDGNSFETQFYDTERPLLAGNDNIFHFRINASGITEDGDLILGLHNVNTIITVEIIEDGTPNLLTGEDISEYMEINTQGAMFHFTDKAEGKEFKIKVEALKKHEDYDVADLSFTANIVVVEGYNVYNALDLSVYDNINTDGMWTTIKEDANLLGVTTNAIILQNKITITKDDVPAEYFWHESDDDYDTINALTDLTLAGSLKDRLAAGIYERGLESGDNFTFFGNYFEIDLSLFPRAIAEQDVLENNENIVNVEDESYMTSHIVVFYNDRKIGEQQIEEDTSIVWDSIYFVGNSALDHAPENSGGIMLMKCDTINFHAYNTVAHNFYNIYFFQHGQAGSRAGNFVVDKCKGYNSYSTHMYLWGADNVLVINSEFKKAGGPAIIADHCHTKNSDGGHPPHINIVASIIESKVTGKEPWFAIYGATSMVQMLAMFDDIYANPELPTTKTIIAGKVGDANDVPQMNIVLVTKSGEAQGLTNERIRGWSRMFDTVEDYEKYYGIDQVADTTKNHGLDMEGDNSVMNKAYGGYFYLQANHSGHYIGVKEAFDQGGNFVGGVDLTTPNGWDLDDGSYCNLYLPQGMGVILQFYPR